MANLIHMKVKKSLDLDQDAVDITAMFERALQSSSYQITSQAYANNLDAFKRMLQEVADKAFMVGQMEERKSK